mmetsp:Transcript_81945/g.228383  ORF Transcript_81945/g.228383 Transcript_81945/m.228383 type:complete len:327 (+) Transcript_81945:772-1752(+)
MVSIRLLKDPPHLFDGPLLALGVGLDHFVFCSRAHRAVDEDAGHHIEHPYQAKANVEGEDEEVELPVVQQSEELPVGHPVVAPGDGRPQGHHRLVQGAEAFMYFFGVCCLLRVADVQKIEIITNGVRKKDPEDKHDNQYHHEGPHKTHEGGHQREDHRPEAPQGLDRSHDADDADEPEDPEDAEEGEVPGNRKEQLSDAADDQYAIEQVPRFLLADEEFATLRNDPQNKLEAEPHREQDFGHHPLGFLRQALYAAVAVLQRVVRSGPDVNRVQRDRKDAEAAERYRLHDLLCNGLLGGLFVGVARNEVPDDVDEPAERRLVLGRFG